jgi:hypothetical protein
MSRLQRQEGWFSIPHEIRDLIYKKVAQLKTREENYFQHYDNWVYEVCGWDDGYCEYWKHSCFRCGKPSYACDLKYALIQTRRSEDGLEDQCEPDITRLRYCQECCTFLFKYFSVSMER